LENVNDLNAYRMETPSPFLGTTQFPAGAWPAKIPARSRPM
jgi:hypothetical protein